MSLSPHHEFHDLINSIMQGEIPREEQMARAVDHLISCSSCLRELLSIAHMINDMPEYLDNLIHNGCQISRLLLPQYVENIEAKAVQKFPFVWEHLQNCEECRRHEEMLRWLVESKEEFGAIPVSSNTRIIAPERKGDPQRIRILQKIKVFWSSHHSQVSIINELTAAIAGKAAISTISTNALAPIFLGPAENEIQAVNYEMLTGLTLLVSIAYKNQLFDLTATIELKEQQSGRIYIKLFSMKNQTRILLAVEMRNNGEKCTFPVLTGGNYELHIETKIDGLLSTWEIPIELAGEEDNGSARGK